MTGERDLDTLIASLSPQLLDGEYVFCTFPGAKYGDHGNLNPVASIQEVEGLTLVIPRAQANQQGPPYTTTLRCISLGVASSLEAIGLTAAVSAALAERGISANLLAGYHHDHVFVPPNRSEEALEILQALGR